MRRFVGVVLAVVGSVVPAGSSSVNGEAPTPPTFEPVTVVVPEPQEENLVVREVDDNTIEIYFAD